MTDIVDVEGSGLRCANYRQKLAFVSKLNLSRSSSNPLRLRKKIF